MHYVLQNQAPFLSFTSCNQNYLPLHSIFKDLVLKCPVPFTTFKDIVRPQEASLLSLLSYGSFLPWRVQLRGACCRRRRRRRRENSYDHDDDDDASLLKNCPQNAAAAAAAHGRRGDIKILVCTCRTPGGSAKFGQNAHQGNAFFNSAVGLAVYFH